MTSRVATVGAALASVAVACATDLVSRPNFVVILGEGQGWSSLSIPMDDRVLASASALFRTPNLDVLARQGMRFAAAYTSLPRCTPARAALFTGRNPAAMHMTFVGEGRKDDSIGAERRLIPPRCVLNLPREAVTIGEYLKAAGYATAHFGKWHVGHEDPALHGFDENDGPTANRGPENVDEPNPKEAFGLTERGLSFMARQAAAGKPFYLQMSHYAGRSSSSARPETLASVQARAGGHNEKEVAAAAVAEDIDTTIGMVLRKIDALGIAGRTYVIYTSDHGTPGWNPPLSGGKGSLAEGGIRVPFIVRGPGVAAGTVAHVPVIATDLFPTLADLAGGVAACPPILEGGSLVPILKHGGTGTVMRPDAELVFHFPHYDHCNEGPTSSILAGDLKLILVYETGTIHLFDISTDPGERKDLALSLPERAAELKARLKTRLKAMDAWMPVLNPALTCDAAPAYRTE